MFCACTNSLWTLSLCTWSLYSYVIVQLSNIWLAQINGSWEQRWLCDCSRTVMRGCVHWFHLQPYSMDSGFQIPYTGNVQGTRNLFFPVVLSSFEKIPKTSPVSDSHMLWQGDSLLSESAPLVNICLGLNDTYTGHGITHWPPRADGERLVPSRVRDACDVSCVFPFFFPNHCCFWFSILDFLVSFLYLNFRLPLKVCVM